MSQHSVITSDRLSPGSLPEILKRVTATVILLASGALGGTLMYDAQTKEMYLLGLGIVIMSLYFAKYISTLVRRILIERVRRTTKFTKDFFSARSLGASHSHAKTIEFTPVEDADEGTGLIRGRLPNPVAQKSGDPVATSPAWITPEQMRAESAR